MKPPDEKTIEELNAAERGRTPRGKWRIIITGVVILVVLIASPLLVIEVNRQAKISRAEDEIIHEGKLAKARFATVSDWPKWYRDHKPDNWGGDRFKAWIDSTDTTEEVRDRRHDFEHQLSETFDRSPEVDAPTPSEVAQFLAETESFNAGASLLRDFDCLSLVPEFNDDGLPDTDALSALWPLRTLISRVFAHALLRDFESAWRELELCMQIALKLTHPSSLVEHMVAFGHELWVHNAARKLCEVSTPPRKLMEAWSDLPSLRKEIPLELARTELAWISIVLDGSEDLPWDYLYMWGDDDRGWFAFLNPKLSWDERQRTINDPGRLARLTADWFRELREYTERMEAGGDPRDWRNDHIESFKDLAARSFEMERRRESTELMAKASIALADGIDMSTVLADYPHHEILRQDEHWVIRLRYTPTVTDNMEDSYATEAEFYEDFRPIKIPLQR